MSRRNPRKNQRKQPLPGCCCPECTQKKTVKKAMDAAAAAIAATPVKPYSPYGRQSV